MFRPTRRDALLAAACAPLAASCAARRAERPDTSANASATDGPLFRISLAQWSLHRAIRSGALDPLDFPEHARRVHGIDAVEYVNHLFPEASADPAWIAELRRRADGAGVRSLLVMVDGAGPLAAEDGAVRSLAIADHREWLDAAAALGCRAVRVNLEGEGSPADVAARGADSLARLADHGAPLGLSVLVENHGGLSSDGAWLADVMERADHPGVGTLPDFGNFQLADGSWYDRYRGVRELMPWARAVSAKAHDFDAVGEEIHTDYRRMLRIVVAAEYRGHVGIEYEGAALTEDQGISGTKALLTRVRAELAGEPVA